MNQEQYLDQLIALVRKELALYTSYAVRLREDGSIRHIYQTRLFKDELDNIIRDDPVHPDKKAWLAERARLSAGWHAFHTKAYLSIRQGCMLPFEYMLRRLCLTPFEQHCARLALAPELNREFERMYGFLQDDFSFKYPSLDLCIKMYTPDALAQKSLILNTFERRSFLLCIFQPQPENLESVLSWKLRLRNPVTDFIFHYESDLLQPQAYYKLCLPLPDPACSHNINSAVSERITQYLRESGNSPKRLLLLHGPPGCGKKLQVRLAASAAGQAALYVDLAEFRGKKDNLRKEWIQTAAVRAALDHACLCWCHWESLQGKDGWQEETIHEILSISFLFSSQVFLTTTTEYRPHTLPAGCTAGYFSLQLPDMRQRIQLWETFLADIPHEGISVQTLAARFDHTPGNMKKALARAYEKAVSKGRATVSAGYIYQACHQMVSHSLGDRASRVNAAFSWEDLVLEENAVKLLRQACSQVSCRYLVYEEWGFQRKMPYGRGVSMLFAGPPGTGKTMAAQVLARELNLEIYKVDLSGVLSKYIGETQKNLRDIFDEVRKSRSILFFDEADVLFGRRVSVTDARDISANAQTAYLLQKMEEYDGITILATNLMQNFDDAYKRRIRYIIQFTFPDKTQRELLWRQVFPARMPLDTDLDTAFLAAGFELSGASIKNIALNAAFLAASMNEITGMKHIITALRQEYLKSGKILGKEELQEYAVYM